MLLRTLQSLLDRSPPGLLREVVLVDDFSSFGETMMMKLLNMRVIHYLWLVCDLLIWNTPPSGLDHSRAAMLLFWLLFFHQS